MNKVKHPHPNIFEFATKELSQDAFICWLVSWADPKFKELSLPLHLTGGDLLERFLKKCEKPAIGTIKKLKVETQRGRIDVLIRINEDIAIIVEDKTDTKEHSNQLERYIKYVTGELEKERKDVATIYFKTGDQSSYDGLKQEPHTDRDPKKNKMGYDYKLFSRSDMIKLLEFGIGQGVNHPIFLDYLEHLRMVESETKSYESVPLRNWKKTRAWQGFFMSLKNYPKASEALKKGGWGYVSNPSGGFMGFWWNRHKAAFSEEYPDFEPYLQLEYKKMCFKIEVDDKFKSKFVDNSKSKDEIKREIRSYRRKIWDKWSETLKRVEEHIDITLARPKQFTSGLTMTVAYIEIDTIEEVYDTSGIIDMGKIAIFLGRAECLMNEAGKSLQAYCLSEKTKSNSNKKMSP